MRGVSVIFDPRILSIEMVYSGFSRITNTIGSWNQLFDGVGFWGFGDPGALAWCRA